MVKNFAVKKESDCEGNFLKRCSDGMFRDRAIRER